MTAWESSITFAVAGDGAMERLNPISQPCPVRAACCRFARTHTTMRSAGASTVFSSAATASIQAGR